MAHNTSGWRHRKAVHRRSGQWALGSYPLSARGDLPLQRACRSKDMRARVMLRIREPKLQGFASLDSNKSLETKDASIPCHKTRGGEPQPNRIYLAARTGGFYSCVNRKLHPNCWPRWAAGLAKRGTSNRLVFETKVCLQQHFRPRWSNFKHSHQSV